MMKPCFLFWKNAAKQMTPAPPATVAMTDAAMLPLLNGLPSNCAGRGVGGVRARRLVHCRAAVGGVAERGRSRTSFASTRVGLLNVALRK